MLTKFCAGLVVLLLCYGAYNRKFADSQPTSSSTPQTIAAIQSAAITSAQPSAPPAISSLNVCSLLDSSEIASVQRTPVQQTQPTGYAYGDVNISQCYYTAVSAGGENLSVHLQVIQRNPKSVRRKALNEYWKASFKHARDENESKEERSEEKENEEEEDLPGGPVSVAGIGHEAFWLASRRGGALYVLTSDKVVRVSAGANDTKAQFEKSKALAEKVLRRLQ
jgi:hypothetical protein